MGFSRGTGKAEAQIRKSTEVWGSWALYSLLAKVIGKVFDLVGGWGNVKLQLTGVGKLNGWLLELNFASQIINCCSKLGFKKIFLDFFISLFTHLHLLNYSLIYLFLNEFYKFY